MQFSQISVSQNLNIIHRNKANTSVFLKKVTLKKHKLLLFKNGGLNDVIEDFFFSKTEEKMFQKVAQMNLMSV